MAQHQHFHYHLLFLDYPVSLTGKHTSYLRKAFLAKRDKEALSSIYMSIVRSTPNSETSLDSLTKQCSRAQLKQNFLWQRPQFRSF